MSAPVEREMLVSEEFKDYIAEEKDGRERDRRAEALEAEIESVLATVRPYLEKVRERALLAGLQKAAFQASGHGLSRKQNQNIEAIEKQAGTRLREVQTAAAELEEKYRKDLVRYRMLTEIRDITKQLGPEDA